MLLILKPKSFPFLTIKTSVYFKCCADLCNEIRVADNGSYEESVVCDLGPLLHPSRAEIKLHLVVGARNGSQVKVPHAVEFQLEGQSRLQIAINTILLELRSATDWEGSQCHQHIS